MERPALDLRIYPPVPRCPEPSDFGYAREDWFDDRSRERKRRAAKQLGDAELAAESYRQMVRGIAESGLASDDAGNVAPGDAAIIGPVRLETHRLGVLKQFAVLDHANLKDYH